MSGSPRLLVIPPVAGMSYYSRMNTPIIPFPAALLPVAPGLCLEDVHLTDQVVVIALRSTCPTAACPRCHQVYAA
jgi:hypothetical protein